MAENGSFDKVLAKMSAVVALLSTISTIILGICTYNLNSKIDTLKVSMEESTMIKTLVVELTVDSSANLRPDFALLSLERYLRHSQPENKLQGYDKDMLVGFAQSMILDRIYKRHKSNSPAEIFIPQNFLAEYDTAKLNEVKASLSTPRTITEDSISSDKISTARPVATIDTTRINSSVLSLVRGKLCYIQYSDPADTALIRRLRANLKNSGWKVPEAERIKGKYKSSVRYFHPDDASSADVLAGSLRDVFHNRPTDVVPVSAYAHSVPVGQVEIWIGPSAR